MLTLSLTGDTWRGTLSKAYNTLSAALCCFAIRSLRPPAVSREVTLNTYVQNWD